MGNIVSRFRHIITDAARIEFDSILIAFDSERVESNVVEITFDSNRKAEDIKKAKVVTG